jgi:hypothetical protein
MFGRVLVKIHHVGGKPNPYRLSSPAASIAVRGTEFIVDVQLGGETLVIVREGLVEVSSRNNPNNKRLVTPGGRVTVQPGGGISSAFPGPRRFLENVAQNSNDISPIVFSAFPDQHLDSLDNPAYAAEVREAQGRLLLLPSISEPYQYLDQGNSSSKGPPRFDYSVSPQLTFFTPIPGSRFVIGGGVSASRTKLQELTNYQSSNYQFYNYQGTRLNTLNASIVAAYSFGDQGRTSAGIGIDRLSGDENVLNSLSEKRPNYELIKNGTSYYSRDTGTKYSSLSFDNSDARFARTRLTLGLARRLSESMKIGIYYRHGFNSSDQDVQQQRGYNNESRPDLSYLAAGRANISAFSSSSEIGVRFRGSLTRRLFYGTEGSYLYERIRSQREASDQPVDHNRYLARRARVGMGLGFLLTSKILLNFDVAGGLFNNSRPPDEPLVVGLNSVSFSYPSLSSLSPSSPNSYRGTSVSAHLAAQANPWRNLILSASGLTTIQSNVAPYYYYYKIRDRRELSSIGLGWKLKPNFIAEYLYSMDHNERVPSHSLRLRYTFSLGITGEK